MGPELVVPMNPVGHCGPRLSEARKVVLPGALILEAAEKALNDSVLLRSVGSDELLRETVVFAGRPEALTLGASNAAPHLRATERRRDPCGLIISFLSILRRRGGCATPKSDAAQSGLAVRCRIAAPSQVKRALGAFALGPKHAARRLGFDQGRW